MFIMCEVSRFSRKHNPTLQFHNTQTADFRLIRWAPLFSME